MGTEVVAAPLEDPPFRHRGIDRGDDSLVTGSVLPELSPQRRTALVRVYLRDRTSYETAGILRVVRGTVRSRRYDGLRGLRAASGSAGGPLENCGERARALHIRQSPVNMVT
ncbi:sigma factor-like helix-turn-helix DNA-binding protein [Streptomyces sp. NPDC059262]|uniref:sigma factor-like helix-turn-helix DNA-binding protein n=1 Tax=Streptomyces sp. NPDC059262 TaxID=3346797 RepID=UPI0036C464EC